MDIGALRDAIRANRKRFRITTHAQVEAAKDGLLLEDLRKVFFEGVVIERSNEVPRVLLFGQAPDPGEWEPNWKRRKRRGDD